MGLFTILLHFNVFINNLIFMNIGFIKRKAKTKNESVWYAHYKGQNQSSLDPNEMSMIVMSGQGLH